MAYAEKRGKGEYPWRVKWTLPSGKEDQASGFRTKQAALKHGRDQEAAIRAGRYQDPKRGQITLDAYFETIWLPAQDIGDNSRSKRRSQYRNHIGPQLGSKTLRDLDPFELKTWENELRGRVGQSWAGHTVELLRLMLDDAVFAGMIGASPLPPKRRRGKRETDRTRPGMVLDLPVILAVCERLPPSEALLVLVKAFTGMRWGEVCGLRRSFLTLHAAEDRQPAYGHYVIDDKIGAVHEDERGRRSFGPPKGGVGRVVELPAFLVVLLLAYLKTLPEGRDLLFVNRDNAAHTRSHFSRNLWRPACDGWPERKTVRGHRAVEAAGPVAFGAVPHDLRHTHKTWLAEDGIEPVARDERLGHVTPGIDGIYIHATPLMRAKILKKLEARWKPFAGSGSPKWAPKSNDPPTSEPLFTLAS